MKYSFESIFLFSLFYVAFLHSSMAVTTTVGGVGADFNTLKEAFDAINNGTLTGSVIVQITGNTTETDSAYLNESGTGSANYNSILIYPTVSSTITGNVNGKLIILNGSDKVTIDGRINQTGNAIDLIIENTFISNNASTIVFQNSAVNNIIQYSKITGASTSTTKGVISFLNAGTGLGNDSNAVQYCTITSNLAGNPRNAIYSNATQAGSTQFNDHNLIAFNKIYDFWHTSGVTISAGICLLTKNSDWEISNNSLYQTVNRSSGYLAFINILTTGGNFTIHHNTFGGLNELADGTFIGNKMNIIRVESSNSIESIINNNVIKGITANFSSSTVDGAFYVYGKTSFTNNTFGGHSVSEGIFHDLNSGGKFIAASSFQNNYASNNDFINLKFDNLMNGIIKIDSNLFEDIIITGSGDGITYCDTVINCVFRNFTGSCIADPSCYIAHNSFRNIYYTSSTGAIIFGQEVDDNYMSNFIGSAGNYVINLIKGYTIHDNIILYDSAATNRVVAIAPMAGATVQGIFNNIIRIKFDSIYSGSVNQAIGIYLTTNNSNQIVYDNTIIIDGKHSSNTYPSACISAAINNLKLKGNLLINKNSADSVLSYCYYGFEPTYSLMDNNNYFYSGDSAFAAYCTVNDLNYPTLQSWKNFTSKETYSFSFDPLFINENEGNAAGFKPQVQMPGNFVSYIDVDILVNTRSNPPTMGAVEYGNCVLDVPTSTTNNIISTPFLSNATYQWFECNNLTPIPGATSDTYLPPAAGGYAVQVNVNSCSNMSNCVTFNPVTALEENLIENSNLLTIFPNPAKSVITIKSSRPTEIYLQNMIGQSLMNIRVKGTETIDMSALSSGLYFIKTNQGQTLKIIKE